MKSKLAPLMTSNRGDWKTPLWLFDRLNLKYQFTVDAAASKENALVSKYWSEEDSAFDHNWDGERVWCNPPYGSGVINWVIKAWESDCVTVMLLPARTDTKWFEYLQRQTPTWRNRPNPYIEFITGRLRFDGHKNSAPFPSILVYFL